MLILNSHDARLAAKKRLPSVLFEYLDGSVSDEHTAQLNVTDFEQLRFRQRVLVDVSQRSTRCVLLGKPQAAPIVLGPVGLAGALRRDGEVLAARAAHAAGIPYCLSMFSIASIRRLREATDGDLWMQLYVTRDRKISTLAAQEARACGVDTLCVTVDTPARSDRERELRSGRGTGPGIGWPLFASLAAKPGWCIDVLRDGVPKFGNVASMPELGNHAFAQAAAIAAQFDASLSWADLRQLRDDWPGKFIVKGILDAEDAREAVRAGADAIVVSNHGGRQLDHVATSISSLPAIAAAVRSELTILLDSGVRRGGDVVKALALGAHGVLIGRPYAYALAADGQRGVENLLARWMMVIDSTLAHIGETDITAVSPSNLN